MLKNERSATSQVFFFGGGGLCIRNKVVSFEIGNMFVLH